MQIKRVLTFIDETAAEAGQKIAPPLRKVAIAAIIDNPFAESGDPRGRHR